MATPNDDSSASSDLSDLGRTPSPPHSPVGKAAPRVVAQRRLSARKRSSTDDGPTALLDELPPAKRTKRLSLKVQAEADATANLEFLRAEEPEVLETRDTQPSMEGIESTTKEEIPVKKAKQLKAVPPLETSTSAIKGPEKVFVKVPSKLESKATSVKLNLDPEGDKSSKVPSVAPHPSAKGEAKKEELKANDETKEKLKLSLKVSSPSITHPNPSETKISKEAEKSSSSSQPKPNPLSVPDAISKSKSAVPPHIVNEIATLPKSKSGTVVDQVLQQKTSTPVPSAPPTPVKSAPPKSPDPSTSTSIPPSPLVPPTKVSIMPKLPQIPKISKSGTPQVISGQSKASVQSKPVAGTKGGSSTTKSSALSTVDKSSATPKTKIMTPTPKTAGELAQDVLANNLYNKPKAALPSIRVSTLRLA